jgi:hypothetical protein
MMSSRIPMKILNRRLILLSAAILFNANTVLAANRVGDAQMQARDLLSGTVGGRTKTVDKSFAISADHRQESYPDPQDQARRLILGKPGFERTVGREFEGQPTTDVPVAARRNNHVHANAPRLSGLKCAKILQ